MQAPRVPQPTPLFGKMHCGLRAFGRQSRLRRDLGWRGMCAL